MQQKIYKFKKPHNFPVLLLSYNRLNLGNSEFSFSLQYI
jgi:hypothetical protein